MLMALDIGNTLINIGYFDGSQLSVQEIDTHPVLSPPEYYALLKRFIKEKNIDKTPEGFIISSVVPGRASVLKKALKCLAPVEAIIIDARTNTGLTIAIPNPGELGTDRIANAVAAYGIYQRPVAAVDFGTATTISVVGEGAEYAGGAIMPGIRLMSAALASRAAKLSDVPIQPPGRALGTDTTKCIQSGLFYGSAGAVERLLREIERELGLRLKFVVTGGHGEAVSKFLKSKHVVKPHLTLEGLRMIYMRNKNA